MGPGARGRTLLGRPPQPAINTADVAALLLRGRTLATPVLRAAVARLAPPMDTVAAYHFGWIDAEGHP
ncbi:dimethylallyltranstransferase, partial [Streptomyces xinghaiensis]